MKTSTDKKKIIAPLITAIILIAVFAVSAVYYYHHTIIRDPEPVDPASSEVLCQINSIEKEDQYLQITGWAFRKDTETVSSDKAPVLKIILSDQNDETTDLIYKADYEVARPEVNDYFANVYDYTNCGFRVRVPQTDLEKDASYEILIQQNERLPDAVRTGSYIRNGELILQDRTQYTEPDVEDTDLEVVVKDGHLCVSRPDIGIYIYQKDWTLYWIIDETYDLNAGYGYLEYQLFTTQPYRLPEERSQAGLTYDSRAFAFAEAEITDTIDSGRYRVAARDIPAEYSVTCIETGCFSQGQWIWREQFVPWYPF